MGAMTRTVLQLIGTITLLFNHVAGDAAPYIDPDAPPGEHYCTVNMAHEQSTGRSFREARCRCALKLRPNVGLVESLVVEPCRSGPNRRSRFGNYEKRNIDYLGRIAEHFPNLRGLDVSRNGIGLISPGALSGLHQLEYLDLSFSRFASFTSTPFSSLSQTLRVLRIHAQDDSALASSIHYGEETFEIVHRVEYSDSIFHNLTSLEYLSLPFVSNYIYAPTFPKLPRLKYVDISCNVPSPIAVTDMELKRSTFLKMNNTVEQLSIRGCFFKRIDGESFLWLRPLRTFIWVQKREEESSVLVEALFSALTRSRLNLNVFVLDCTRLNCFGLEFANARIQSVPFFSNVFPSLEYIVVRSAELFTGAYELPAFKSDLKRSKVKYLGLLCESSTLFLYDESFSYLFYQIPLLETLDLSCSIRVESWNEKEKPIRCLPEDISGAGENDCPYIRSPPAYISDNLTDVKALYQNDINDRSSIRYVYLDNSQFPPSLLENILYKYPGRENWTVLNMSNTLITQIKKPVVGLGGLRVLDLSSSDLQEIHPDSLAQLTSLRHLLLQYSRLSVMREGTFTNLSSLTHLSLHHTRIALGNTSDLDSSFAGLVSLTDLDLSWNDIRYLSSATFSHTPSLARLNLSHNLLTRLEVDVSGTIHHAQVLDFSHNQLVDLNAALRRQLEHPTPGSRLQVDLSGNQFVCDCSAIDFITWVQRHSKRNATGVDLIASESYNCVYLGKAYITPGRNISMSLMDIDTSRLRDVCAVFSDWYTIAVPLCFLLLIVIVLILVYRYRWHVRFRYFKLKARMGKSFQNILGIPQQESEMEIHDFDIFVSYSHPEEYTWLREKLLPVVEEEWGWQTCVAARDFLPGAPIAENIAWAVDSSKKTLVVLTPAFCTSQWCEFELQMALTRGLDHVLVVYLQAVEDDHAMSRTLRRLLKLNTYLDWAGADEMGRRLFWDRLKASVPTNTGVDSRNPAPMMIKYEA